MENRIPRPSGFDGYVCDPAVKTRVMDYITAAKKKCLMPPHMLFTGGPGTGKSTIAGIIARTLNVPVIKFLGQELKTPAQLRSLLEIPEYGGILFLDEIHAVPTAMAELLYTIMEDGVMNSLGDPQLQLYLNPLMVIGATTEPGKLPKPLRDRFVVKIAIKPYTEDQMLKIVKQMAGKLSGTKFPEQALADIAGRSKGTPRIAGSLLYQVCDTAIAHGVEEVSPKFVDETLALMDIDRHGLDRTDREILSALKTNETLGLSTLATIVGIDEASLAGTYEPYLLQQGYLVRTKSGRKLTEKGINLVS